MTNNIETMFTFQVFLPIPPELTIQFNSLGDCLFILLININADTHLSMLL